MDIWHLGCTLKLVTTPPCSNSLFLCFQDSTLAPFYRLCRALARAPLGPSLPLPISPRLLSLNPLLTPEQFLLHLSLSLPPSAIHAQIRIPSPSLSLSLRRVWLTPMDIFTRFLHFYLIMNSLPPKPLFFRVSPPSLNGPTSPTVKRQYQSNSLMKQ